MPIRRVTASVLATLILAAQTYVASSQDTGRKLAEWLQGCTKAISNPIIQSFVESLSQRLAAQLPKRDSPFTFSVIAEDLSSQAHEPIALPGGYIFVPATLFVAAQDEAECAGILAQAMARGLTSQTSIGTIVPSCAARGPIPISTFGEERALEQKADLTAIQVMAAAGFDPDALVRYVERVQAGEGRVGEVFSVLPPVKKRVAKMKAEIAKLPPRAYPAINNSAFVEATEQVRRLLTTPSSRSDAPTLKRK